MEIRGQYLQKYLHDIAIDQLADDYISKGYRVNKEKLVGRYHADLVAEKENETIVVEVRTGKMTSQKRTEVAGLSDYIRNRENHRFLVVLANPPKPKRIDIPNLDQLLAGYLINNFSEHLKNKIFAHTQFGSVADVVLNEVILTEEGSIKVEGNALVEIELRYSNNFDGAINNDSIAHLEVFPCTFSIALTYTPDKKLIVSAVDELTIDNSDYSQE